jgi:hypothetical protein
MLDDEVRAQLADWVAPLAELPAPDIRVLRRRNWRRRARWSSGAVAAIAVAVAIATATLPGSGRPAGPAAANPAAGAPGTWYPGRWFAAGQLPAADAGPAATPFVVTIKGGREVVTNALTGATAGTANPPPGASFAGVAAAADDHTFVLAARGGAAVSFYEQRLGPGGRPAPPVLVFTLPASSVPTFALSPDASQLAYATPGGIRVLSLATGAGRSWTASGGEVVGLSWAGAKALAFAWAAISHRQVNSVTARLLATTASGTRLLAAPQLVPACASSSRTLCLQQYPLGTADGSKVFVSDQFNRAGALTADVEEFSGATRRTVFSQTAEANSPAANSDCAPVWTDPSGEQLAVYCGGRWTTIKDGHARAVSVRVPVSPSAVAGQLIAW